VKRDARNMQNVIIAIKVNNQKKNSNRPSELS